jgi:hypothetical protein
LINATSRKAVIIIFLENRLTAKLEVKILERGLAEHVVAPAL